MVPTKYQSPDSLYFLITYIVCKKRKYYFFTFLNLCVWETVALVAFPAGRPSFLQNSFLQDTTQLYTAQLCVCSSVCV